MSTLGFLHASNAPNEAAAELVKDVALDKEWENTIYWFHDESTFNANDDQVTMWKDETMQIIKPKGRGAGLMVSDFIEERDGYCALTDKMFASVAEVDPTIKQSARVIFEYGKAKEGYWNSDLFLEQIIVKLVIHCMCRSIKHTLLCKSQQLYTYTIYVLSTAELSWDPLMLLYLFFGATRYSHSSVHFFCIVLWQLSILLLIDPLTKKWSQFYCYWKHPFIGQQPDHKSMTLTKRYSLNAKQEKHLFSKVFRRKATMHSATYEKWHHSRIQNKEEQRTLLDMLL